jgi:hypothetical protein
MNAPETRVAGTDAAAAWPPQPYKGVAYFNAGDRPLFSGRDTDVDLCIQRLTALETRVLLIHGHTGCGKSSFLRAGLIPELEGMELGYMFMRDRDGSPLFIRSGADPLGRLADQVYRFACESPIVQTSRGPTPIDLSPALLGHRTAADFIEDCRQHGSLIESLRLVSTLLPWTLIVVLDQMEEVITLFENKSPHRRQFFQFVKGFSSVNFPVKFVFALRKDYSGQFIELAQLGGGIDMREPRPASDAGRLSSAGAGAPERREVKSDVKLYLLPELDKEKVARAITYPTREEHDEGEVPARSVYRFSYEPAAVKELVADLFKESGAAVLPAMQIVCRELFREVDGSDLPHRVITLAQYERGGRVAGRIDRHVSNALVGAFGSQVRTGDLAREEDKWRQVLCKFVKLESDGTAHTRELSPEAVAAFAREAKASSDTAAVIASLTDPDVLLLRSVRSEVDGADCPQKLSLGHDFIAMVLHRWSLGREEKQKARRLKRKVTAATVLALVSAALFVVWTALSMRAGKAEQEYDVLLNTTLSQWRQQPMPSILTAAAATMVADKAALFEPRDRTADQTLSDLLASLPDVQSSFPVDPQAMAQAARIDGTFPLARSRGFLTVSGEQATFTSEAQTRKFTLQPLPGADSASTSRIMLASEAAPGVVTLLRMRVAAGGLPTLLAFQVDVLRADGRSSGPFGPEVFGKTLPKEGEPPRPTNLQLGVTGSAVVFWTSTPPQSETDAVHNSLEAYAFDPRAAEVSFSSVATLDDTTLGTGDGKDLSLWFNGGYVVAQYGFSNAAGPTVRRFDLGAPAGAPVELLGPGKTPRCANGCSWKWLSFMPPDARFIVYGAPDPRKSAFGDQWSENSLANVGNYVAFMLLDVESGQTVVVDAAQIERARSNCSPFQREKLASSQAATLQGASAFATRAAAASAPPLLGIVAGGSVDLLELQASSGPTTATCRRSLLSLQPMVLWAVTDDGKRLLGGGTTSLAGWDLPAQASPRTHRLASPDTLRHAACKRGLAQEMARFDAAAWRDLTHLSSPPVGLCDGPSALAPATPSASPSPSPR